MKRKSKQSDRHGKRKRDDAPGAPKSASGFTIRDRSGKVHVLGTKRGERIETREAEERPAPKFKSKSKGAGSDSGPSHHRGQKSQPRPERRGGGFRGRRPHPEPREGARTLKATVDKNRKGFAFLIFENRKTEDAFVPPHAAESLFHGDRVEVELTSRGEVAGLRVLSHRFRELVGRYSPHPTGKGGFAIYERKRAREEVYCAKGAPGAKAGDWVRVRLTFDEEGLYPVTGEILEVYGPDLPASADVGMIAAEFALIEEHPAEAEREARALQFEIDSWRIDLREVPFITIDGETARDFDDAIYVERAKSGYILWVAIADVSHYVREGTALDKDARSRGTSVYFPERAFHMLPRALSEGLCSLRPNEPRLALVARIEYDYKGKPTRTELFEAVIESKRRATYNEIQEEWEANRKNKDWEYAAHAGLYQMIRKSRSERGSIDFDLPEAEVVVDEAGVPLSITKRDRLDAHRLIEEFMIAANEAVTEWIMEREWPFIYRVHDEPASLSLEKFQDLAATVGVAFSYERGGNINEVLAELVDRIEGHPAQALLNMALLRSMKQAIYSATHGIHFGLASNAYTHFTSPIRRYPDLLVHRMLRMALRTEKKQLQPLSKKARKELEDELADLAEHCSYRERLAAEADREAIRLKQVRAILPRLGDEFDAKVVGMADAGLFVQVDDPYVEGLLSKDTLNDDFYQFNEDKMLFVGSRTKRIFRIGDPIQVRAVRADLDRREIDFAPVAPGAEGI